MKLIESTLNKETKGKIIYAFSINNEQFSVNYNYGIKPTVELLHNNSVLGFIDQPKNKFDFIINSELEQIKIKIWIEYYNVYAINFGKINGIGIEVNEVPVKNTLSDPETHIKQGKSGLYFLLFLLGFNNIITYYTIFKDYYFHILTLFSSISLIPFFIMLVLIIKFKNWTKIALYTGFIISILEMFAFIYFRSNRLLSDINNDTMSGTSFVIMLIWVLFRLGIMNRIYNAIKWNKIMLWNKVSI